MSQSGDRARDVHPGTIKLIAIGQSLRGDDAAGLAAVRLWQEKYQLLGSHPDLQVELAELPGVGLLSLLEGCRFAILVDAVRSGAKAGTIHILHREQLETFQAGTASAHGWGVAETLELGQQLMPTALPDKLVVIGIEAGSFSPGEPLSPEVEAALPEVARLVEQLLKGESSASQAQPTSPRISPR